MSVVIWIGQRPQPSFAGVTRTLNHGEDRAIPRLPARPGRRVTPAPGMVGGGPHNLKPGEWADDTSFALCLAESLIERRGFDPIDQLERYTPWYLEGRLSSAGDFFSIGTGTRGAIERFMSTREPFPGLTDEESAGNGSLVRVCPVPIFHAADPVNAIEVAGESSRATHALPVIRRCLPLLRRSYPRSRATGRSTRLSPRSMRLQGGRSTTGNRRQSRDGVTLRPRLRQRSGRFPGAAPLRRVA